MKPSPVPSTDSDKHKVDARIKADVLDEMKYEPTVLVTDIGVLVKDGVVTLNGIATSHGEKWHAVCSAKRVAGVQAIADNIIVAITGPHKRTDAEIATAAAHQMEWSTTVPNGSIHITVSDGWITLEGEVEWWYQKNAVQDAMTYLVGVNGINNGITIRPVISASDIGTSIKAAFKRSALLDAKKIHVETNGTNGTNVTLTGTVANNTERDEAERVAWAAPGVSTVDNQVKLAWSWGMML